MGTPLAREDLREWLSCLRSSSTILLLDQLGEAEIREAAAEVRAELRKTREVQQN